MIYRYKHKCPCMRCAAKRKRGMFRQRPKRTFVKPESRLNKVVKSKIKDGTDMLKSSTYLCNRDRQYLKKIYNAGKVKVEEVPITTVDKLLALGFIKQAVEFSKSDVEKIKKVIKVGEVDGVKLYELKNLIFKDLVKRSCLTITEEGQNALTVSIVANIKTL